MGRQIELILLVIVAVVIKFSSAADYCSIKSCQNPSSHTLCTYKKSGPSSKCQGVQGDGLSSDEKNRIVELHNKLRQKVAGGQEKQGSPGPQPAAKNMANLEWDEELATIAQRWADQCNFSHDKCRNVERYSVGQNIATSGTSGDPNGIKVESLVQMWYDEVKDFDKNTVSNFKGLSNNGKVVGHYSQFVWAKTNKIGCGAIKYKDQGFNQFYLVCNYGPTGNYRGKAVYETN